jgi:hypothetical protein
MALCFNKNRMRSSMTTKKKRFEQVMRTSCYSKTPHRFKPIILKICKKNQVDSKYQNRNRKYGKINRLFGCTKVLNKKAIIE